MRRTGRRLIIFDDGRGRLGPMTDLRASFEVRTGVTTTAHRLAAAFPRMLEGYWVPEPLAPLVSVRANAPVNRRSDEEVLLLANGRWARPDEGPDLEEGEAWVEQATGDVICAVLRRADALALLEGGDLPDRVRVAESPERRLYRHPWDVLPDIRATITHDIERMPVDNEALVARDVAAVVGDAPVQVHRSAVIGAGVVLDATDGPILVQEGAAIRHGAVLIGPCSIGRRSIVADRSIIKSGTSIGPECKVGGEVGATIFQGCANKVHDGHLGDSWVGKWANLGAGTTNSNLLNTYGDVVVRTEVDGPRQRTGLTFCGAFVGDHVKTAIGTRIMTGTVLGTGAMIARSTPPPSTVPRFAWMTDDGDRVFRIEKFLEVARTVMGRRGRTPSDAYEALVIDLHRRRTGGGS
jgi:UDP-N-acetylglucosamine diphosphorylase/glucosamine-1-phosphate N-acetyltransferase